MMDAFETFLRTECGYSECTIKDYRNILKRINRWFQAQGVKSLDSALPSEVRAFVRMRSGQGYGPTTINKEVSAVLTYWKFLGRSAEDRAGLERPRQPFHLPNIPNAKEMAALLDAVSDLRDRAILEVLYATGVRADELCELDAGDLEADHLRVRQGKGAKDRLIPIGGKARDALAAYWFARPTVLPADPMFLTRTGDRLSYCALEKVVKRAGKGHRCKITPHTFRHCFATHMLQGKANLREIQVMMGHSSLEATARYLHLDSSHLRAIHARCHPRERLAAGLPAVVPIAERAA